MTEEENVLYKFDDALLFRLHKKNIVRFHCAKHSEIELVTDPDPFKTALHCVKCGIVKEANGRTGEFTYDFWRHQAKSLLNAPKFEGAKIIRLDDYYVPELKIEIKGSKSTITNKSELPSDYKVVCDIKKDKDGDTLIMLQVFKKGSGKGAQFFIKPEKAQLTSDHNNPDPKDMISDIQVTLRDRILTQDYTDTANSDGEFLQG